MGVDVCHIKYSLQKMPGAKAGHFNLSLFEPYFIVGITNSAPARIPVGQRLVMVLSLV